MSKFLRLELAGTDFVINVDQIVKLTIPADAQAACAYLRMAGDEKSIQLSIDAANRIAKEIDATRIAACRPPSAADPTPPTSPALVYGRGPLGSGSL